MTSRTSSSIDNRSTAGFIRRQRELFRRRLWPAALTFVSYLLYHVAGTARRASLRARRRNLGSDGV